MRTVPTKLWHTFHVLAHLSAQNRAELARIGLSREEAFAKLKGFLKEGAVTSLLLEDNKPCCVFGVIPGEGNYRRTWFIATERYWQLGMAGVRHARGFIKEAASQGPLLTGCSSPHPDVERWFRLIGYEKLEEIDGVQWFKYE